MTRRIRNSRSERGSPGNDAAMGATETGTADATSAGARMTGLAGVIQYGEKTDGVNKGTAIAAGIALSGTLVTDKLTVRGC